MHYIIISKPVSEVIYFFNNLLITEITKVQQNQTKKCSRFLCNNAIDHSKLNNHTKINMLQCIHTHSGMLNSCSITYAYIMLILCLHYAYIMLILCLYYVFTGIHYTHTLIYMAIHKSTYTTK